MVSKDTENEFDEVQHHLGGFLVNKIGIDGYFLSPKEYLT